MKRKTYRFYDSKNIEQSKIAYRPKVMHLNLMPRNMDMSNVVERSGIMFSFIFCAFVCKEIEKIVRPLGFKRYHRFFYRITDDGVVQQFCLLCLHGKFTIRFTLNSIFCDNDKTKEGSEIHQIIDGTNSWISETFERSVINGMTVYNHKQISYKEAINICKNALQDVLLPYFEKTKDSKNAHDYMIENDSLVKSGTQDFDTREIGFYLSKENYDKAREVLEYYIENKNKWNKIWWEEKEVEYQELYDAIKNNDMNYIQEYKKDKKRKTCIELEIRGI